MTMPVNYRPRVSSGPPYDVERWEVDNEAPDFSSFGYKPEGVSLPDLGIGLSMGLQLPVATAPTYEEDSEGATVNPALSRGRIGRRTSGGTGLGAYGFGGLLDAATINKYRNKSNPYGVHSTMYRSLGLLNAAMKSAGLGTFRISDGWRSYAVQFATKKKKGKLAATPGGSVHGIGAAVDISATRRQKEWLYANAKQFGLYFPFFAKEDWHLQLDPKLF